MFSRGLLLNRRALARPSWLFDFMPGSLPVGASLTRASSGTRFNSSGVMVGETTDVARFTFDPVSLALRGLLVEPSRTNLFRPSEDFTSYPMRVNVTLASGTAPDGNNTANLVAATGSSSPTGVERMFDASEVASGDQVALSAYAKAGAASYFGLGYTVLANGFTQMFDIANGLVAELGGESGGSYAMQAASIANAGGGWFRASMTGQATWASDRYYADLLFAPAASGNTYAGGYGEVLNGFLTNDARIWGIQLEKAADTSSYIPTTSTAATRAADVLTLAVPNGQYTVELQRESGMTVVRNAVVSGGTYTVPTDVSPLQRVLFT